MVVLAREPIEARVVCLAGVALPVKRRRQTLCSSGGRSPSARAGFSSGGRRRGDDRCRALESVNAAAELDDGVCQRADGDEKNGDECREEPVHRCAS